MVKKLKWLISFWILLTLGIVFLLIKNKPTKPFLPVIGKVPNFELENTKKQKFSLAKLKNKVWVADFFFTTCGGPCPIMTKKMAFLQQKFAGIKNVNFVSITVNPKYDTAEVLAKYAAKHKANDQKWHFLTGSKKKIYDLAIKGFKLATEEQTMVHSEKFVLVDSQGQIRSYYNGTDQQHVEQLARDITRVLKE